MNWQFCHVVFVQALVIVIVVCSGENGTIIKDCAPNETCTVELTTVTTKTTKSTPLINVSSSEVIPYNVSGNNTDGSVLKEIVVIDTTTPLNGTDHASQNSGNTSGKAHSNVTATKTVLQTDTTNSNSTNTTTATTTTTATATTTTGVNRISPTNNGASEVVRFVPNKYCYCDIIYGGCDINCCCDTDCASQDLKTFTLCSDQVQSNLIKPESIIFDSSLFYVVIENVPSDYFYPERDPIKTELQVVSSLRNRNIYTWHDAKIDKPLQVDSTAHNSYDLTYKSLRWMYTAISDVNSSEIKPLGLKNSVLNSLCMIEEPVKYLTTKETNCQMFVLNLTDVCNNQSSLNFKHYYGERGIFKVVRPIWNTAQKTEKIGLSTIQATAHHSCIATNGSSYDCRVQKSGDHPRPGYHPVYLDGVCRRAVVAVEYRVTHNGTGGVRRVDVYFHHRDVRDARKPVFLDQKFGVRFTWALADRANHVQTYDRSGKPGYTTGGPVLITTAGSGDGKDAEKRLRPKPMGLPDPDERGACDADSGRGRLPVNFLENVDVQCRVRVKRRRRFKRTDETVAALTELCHEIQNETISALGDYEGILVASLGDPDVAGWIPTLVVKPQVPPPSDDSCLAVTDKVHIRVLYSYVGTYDHPRATILGVLVNYTASAVRVVTADTVRAHSDNDTAVVVADIPIRASVVFVDLTRPPVRTFAEPPTYEFKLPEDFYYPFWSFSDSGGSATFAGFTATVGSTGTAFGLRSKIEFSFLLFITLFFSYLSRVSYNIM